MHTEKITVRVTESRQLIDVVVYDKRASSIRVVFGAGMHSVKCELTPTRNGLAYAGSIMGREVAYERSRPSCRGRRACSSTSSNMTRSRSSAPEGYGHAEMN